MTVSAPSDDPRYVYGSPPPPNAIDPGMWARVMGFASGLNPIGSANAAEAPMPGPGGFQGPGTAAQSGGYPVNQAGQPQYAFPHIREALASGPGDTNMPAILPHLTGNGPNVQGRPILPYANPNTRAIAEAAATNTNLPGGVSGGSPGYDPLSSIQARQPLDPNDPRTRNMPWPTAPSPMGPSVPPGGVQPAIATAAAPATAAIDPRMRGEVPPAQSPWITSAFDRPNMNPGLGGGMMGGALAANQSGRGGGGPAQMGMLDLSGIFRGGQPAAAAAAPAQPRTKIDVGKIPADARAEVPPVKRSKAPWGYGPYQKGKGTGPFTQY